MMLYLNEDAVIWHKTMKSGRGGKRDGAGRKRNGELAKVKINITISPDLLDWIDGMTDNRSAFIEDLVREKSRGNINEDNVLHG